MSNRIIVEFSGWAECNSDEVKFQYIGNDADDGPVITGTEWLKLSEDDRDNYILEDFVHAQETALDSSLEHLDVIVADENGNEVTASRTYS
jgi:hypothetical protein